MQITNKIPREKIEEVASYIHKHILTAPELTNRRLKNIQKLLQRDDIFVYFDNSGNPIGFIIREKLWWNLWEIKSWYIEKSYRGQHLAMDLLKASTVDKTLNYFAATFQTKVVKATESIGFNLTPLSKLPAWISIQYILSRNVLSILKHLAKEKSSFVLKKKS